MSAFVISRFIYLTLLLLLVLTDICFVSLSFWFYLLPSLLFIVLIAFGSANMRFNFFVKAQTALPTDQKVIALTFDDGPSPEYTPAVLEVLDKYDVKATFFCIGHKIEEHKASAKNILEKGHAIGNHSYNHGYLFSFFGTKRIMDEIRQTNHLIEGLSGSACTIFRPPYGVTNPSVAKAVQKFGMQVIGWNIRSYDTTIGDYHKVVKRVTSKIKPGAIILLHDNRANTPKILEAILHYAQENDYHYVQVNTY